MKSTSLVTRFEVIHYISSVFFVPMCYSCLFDMLIRHKFRFGVPMLVYNSILNMYAISSFSDLSI